MTEIIETSKFREQARTMGIGESRAVVRRLRTGHQGEARTLAAVRNHMRLDITARVAKLNAERHGKYWRTNSVTAVSESGDFIFVIVVITCITKDEYKFNESTPKRPQGRPRTKPHTPYTNADLEDL